MGAVFGDALNGTLLTDEATMRVEQDALGAPSLGNARKIVSENRVEILGLGAALSAGAQAARVQVRARAATRYARAGGGAIRSGCHPLRTLG